MRFNPYKQHTQIEFFDTFLLYFNKLLIFIQQVIFVLLGLFSPLAVGWYTHNENYLSSFTEKELQQIAACFYMPVDKFSYVYNNFVIAITALFVLLFWRICIWTERRTRNNPLSLTVFQIAVCMFLFDKLVIVLKYLFSNR